MPRSVHHRWIPVATAVSCLLGVASVGAAQSDSSHARTIGVRVAIGTALDRYSEFDASSGPLGIVGLQWQRPGSRLSGRLEVSGQWDSRRTARFRIFCGEDCISESERRLVGLSFDGQYDVTRSVVRPYIVSGVGLYHATERTRQNYFCAFSSPSEPPACTSYDEMQTIANTSTLAIGLHAGAGLGVTIGRATLFGEARYSLLSGDGMLEGWRMPVLIGVRF